MMGGGARRLLESWISVRKGEDARVDGFQVTGSMELWFCIHIEYLFVWQLHFID